MSLRARLAVVGVAAACLFMAPAVHSQAITGTIQGTVVDEDGGGLPGVTVSVINVATGYESIVRTNDRGFFQAQLLPLGPYAVTFELEGFATLIREGLELALGQTIDLRVELQLSTVGEEITVTDAAPLIEISRTESQVRFDDRSIEGLPNDGRDFLAFSKLTPGVTIVQGPDGEELSINGQKGINNNVMVDGADFNNPFFGEQRGGQRPAFTFNIDAVKEMVVITDGAPAEFGRSSGGFVNVITKSGTNSLRGSAHGFIKNDSLSSNPQLRSGGREPDSSFDQTQFGFTIGGPIQKDKMFFFLAADAQRAEQTKQTNPNRIRSDVVDFLASVGLPNENAPINRTDDGDAYLAKLDYQVNDSNLFTARWAYHYSQQVNGTFDVDSWGTSANGVEDDWAHGYTASLISNVSSSMLNEFRGQYAKEWRPRPYNGPQVSGQDRPFPDTAFDFALGVRVGMPFFLPVEYDDDRLQLNNNVSLLSGDHSFKAGVEYNEVTSSQTFIGFASGRYVFGSFDGFRNYVTFGPGYVECADPVTFADFNTSTDGTCAPGTSIVGPLLLFLQQAGVGGLTVEEAGTQALAQKETAIFIQDQWRPTANMTVEFGVRWEKIDQPSVITPPSEVFFAPFIGQSVTTAAGEQRFPSNGDIPDDDVIQPRFALSFTPKGKTDQVFRFNAGLFAARIPALTLASVRSTNGSRGQTLFAASFFRPPTWPNLLPAEAAAEPFFPDVYVFDEDFQLPQTWAASLSWEGEVKPNWALLVKANYAKTDHITRWANRNDALLGSPWGSGLPPAGVNGIGALNTVESTAKSRYQGITLGINKRWSNNYQFQAYYTLSKDESDDDNERDPFTLRYANITNLGPEFGYSDRHQENRFNFWLSWLAPYDINVNVRFTYLDAQPLDIAPDGSLTTFPPTQRCIGGCTIGGPVFQRNQGKKDNEFQTLDLRISKDFQVGNTTVQPVIDVFNLTDEPNFLVPEVGELVFNFDGTVRSGGGDPREIQVGVRVVW